MDKFKKVLGVAVLLCIIVGAFALAIQSHTKDTWVYGVGAWFGGCITGYVAGMKNGREAAEEEEGKRANHGL